MNCNQKIFLVLILLSVTITGCVRYEARYANIFADGRGPGWLIFRNDFYVPEYTQVGKEKFAASKEEAEALFALRRKIVEPLLWKKYEKPTWQSGDYVYAPTAFLFGPLIDIVYLPVIWTMAVFHKAELPKNGKLFPFTSNGISALFYGPANWLFNSYASSLREKKEWGKNPSLEKNFQALLREKKVSVLSQH